MHTKPDFNPGAIVDSLAQLGMQIPEREDALSFVRHFGADVLQEYLPPFRHNGRFDGAKFADVAGLFAFDAELRMLVMGAAGLVEISLRAQMTARDVLPPAREDKKETTMGDLSWHYLKNLAPAERQKIADIYGMDEKILAQFFHHLTVVRNFCAHHRRLWNWRFHKYPFLPVKKPALRAFFNHNERGKLYNTLVILVHMTDAILPPFDLRRRLSGLLAGRGETTEAAMGFLHNWRALSFWRKG